VLTFGAVDARIKAGGDQKAQSHAGPGCHRDGVAGLAGERRVGLHRRGPAGKGWRGSLAGSGPLPAVSLPVRFGPLVRRPDHGLLFPL